MRFDSIGPRILYYTLFAQFCHAQDSTQESGQCALANIECSDHCKHIEKLDELLHCWFCGHCHNEQTTTDGIDIPKQTATIEEINADLNAYDTINQFANLTIELDGQRVPLFDMQELEATAAKIIQLHKMAQPELNFTKNNTSLFLEGDMLLTPEQLERRIESSKNRTKRKTSNELTNWPTTINYQFNLWALFNPALKDGVSRAATFWTQNTCLTFQEGSTTPLIVFTHSFAGGCSSSLGMVKNRQSINLGPGCEHWGIVAHEVAHALGLFHEQSRPDRDSYVVVKNRNLQLGMEVNFERCDKQGECHADVPYDYGSNMHYGRFAFSRRQGQESLSALQSDYKHTMGSRRLGPTFYDIQQINKKYCGSTCSNTAAACQNGGYPNPAQCSKCLCPEPFSGDLCQNVKTGSPSACGGKLTATENFQSLSPPKNLGSKQQCSWLITPSTNSKIELKFETQFGLEAPRRGFCDRAFVEIRTSDLSNTGPRFCGQTAPTKTFVTTSSRAAVLLRSFEATGMESTGFTIQYRSQGAAGKTTSAAPNQKPEFCCRRVAKSSDCDQRIGGGGAVCCRWAKSFWGCVVF